MFIGIKVKEEIARTIAKNFSTNEIISIFNGFNIPTDEALYAKWRITLDGFNKIKSYKEAFSIEIFFNVLQEFCHPLNFPNQKTRLEFIDSLEKALSYEDIEINVSDRSVQFNIKKSQLETGSTKIIKYMTTTDYVVEVINFFKNEYNKIKIKGLKYDYFLGEIFSLGENLEYSDEYKNNLEALDRLKEAGFIKEYLIKETVDDNGVWAISSCWIDEDKLTQKEAPSATKAGVRSITEQVVKHEHFHKFENSIQEKKISLEHKNMADEFTVKGKKKIALPKFSATAWSKVQIRFINKNTVYITADKKTAPADYEGLDFCNDKNGKPNTAWKFLLELSKNNGETSIIPSPIPDKIKNQKRVLSDKLKTIFKNDTDPFEDFNQSKKYKIKIKLIPPTEELGEDKYGINSYLDETMISQYEADK